MTEFSPHVVVPLLVWGSLVGLDLVSVPQAMISRPLVAGTVAGWLAGDTEAGLRIGVLFELFALDILPVGAVRYPDYGPATVVAAALAAGTPWELSLGVSAALGLVLAVVGGWSLQVVRRWNARAIQRKAAALSAGESSAIRWLQYGGLLRDAVRGLILTLLGLILASTITDSLRVDRQTAVALTLVSIGSALSAGGSAAFRSSGRGDRLKWLVGGLVVGTLIAVLA
ncbi:MAG TPA: PTS sugar transporter subunit IIC [Gemmatimonadales bacterium]|jgi:PTS system mannose-specific IIC component|nr:PTS sugar transporter subunit IIC [Gemmatimonadales bacterium]